MSSAGRAPPVVGALPTYKPSPDPTSALEASRACRASACAGVPEQEIGRPLGISKREICSSESIVQKIMPGDSVKGCVCRQVCAVSGEESEKDKTKEAFIARIRTYLPYLT